MRPQRGTRGGSSAPALLVLGIFFFLPVLAALAMSLTDFDLYALADIGNLRFVGFENYWRLLHEPLFWKSLGNTFYFVVLGVPLSIGASLGAALLRELQAGALHATCFARSTSRPSSRRWSPSPSSGATSSTRATGF